RRASPHGRGARTRIARGGKIPARLIYFGCRNATAIRPENSTTKAPRHEEDYSGLVSWCLCGELLRDRPPAAYSHRYRPAAARPFAAISSKTFTGREKPLRSADSNCSK